MTDRQDIIAAHIQFLSESLERQCDAARGWPHRLIFPEPRNKAEREAMKLFLLLTESATGQTVKFTTEAGQDSAVDK